MFPGLAAFQDLGEVVVAGVAEGWPFGEAEVGDGLVGAVGGQHCPGHGRDRVLGEAGVFAGFGVGFGDPVAAWLVAVSGLLSLERGEKRAKLAVLAVPGSEVSVVARPFRPANPG